MTTTQIPKARPRTPDLRSYAAANAAEAGYSVTYCALCHDTVASVFTADHPLCKPCHREVKRLEQYDYAVPNTPWCAECGSVLDRHGCAECDTTSLTRFASAMRRVG